MKIPEYNLASAPLPDFGWDLLASMRTVGFPDAQVLVSWSDRWGYYGVEQLLIVAKK